MLENCIFYRHDITFSGYAVRQPSGGFLYTDRGGSAPTSRKASPYCSSQLKSSKGCQPCSSGRRPLPAQMPPWPIADRDASCRRLSTSACNCQWFSDTRFGNSNDRSPHLTRRPKSVQADEQGLRMQAIYGPDRLYFCAVYDACVFWVARQTLFDYC